LTYKSSTKCGGSNNTVIRWGGPIAIYRSDRIPDMGCKRL
jgi:hypothetical protein